MSWTGESAPWRPKTWSSRRTAGAAPSHLEPDGTAVWTVPVDALWERFGTRPVGLDAGEVARRLASGGPNRLPEGKKKSALALFASQFKSFLILLLLGAAVLALSIGEIEDAIVVTGVVLFNAVLGFAQEHRAEAAIAALRNMLTRSARVRRAGQEEVVPAEEVVPGDIVLLEAGDRVPADGRWVVLHALEVDESSLTGESVPTVKRLEAQPDPKLAVGDRINTGFMNTVVTRGRGELLVTATGSTTEMGQLAAILGSTPETTTPLQIQIDVLGRRLALIAGVAVALIVTLQLLRGIPLVQLVMEAVAIAVAAIPEGLPAVVTVTLAIGMRRMARDRAIVKRMSAVETLGCTTDICSDKTGTLTLNQMTARRVVLREQTLGVTGEGYKLDGAIEGSGASLAQGPELEALLRAVALCNDSSVRDEEVVGDPTEGALWVLAAKGGLDVEALQRSDRRVAELPFEADRKFSATVHASGVLLAKGAPEVLLERCVDMATADGARPLEEHDRAHFAEQAERLANEGLRVLAVCMRDVDVSSLPREEAQLEPAVHELVLLGFVGLLDPPRAEAREAIAVCKRAGIAVRLITGDHPGTGLAVARALGIEGDAMSGSELDHLDDETLAREMGRLGVLARVSPQHKVRAVDALRARGRVVAMIGDGVNDAPALRRADIGVSMGMTGTEVAKEAATLVLADDNFSTILTAVKEGRTIYDNIVRFLRFQLSTNMGALLAIFFAPILGLPVPFTPLQILWVNLIMDGPPAMALGKDPPHPRIMEVPPRDPKARILTVRRLVVLLFFGAIMATGTLGVLAYALPTHTPAEAITLAFTTFVLFQIFNVFNARFERSSALGRHALSNDVLWMTLAVVLALQIAVVHVPAMQPWLSTTALSLEDWGLAVGVASSVLVFDELRKLGLKLWARSVRRG